MAVTRSSRIQGATGEHSSKLILDRSKPRTTETYAILEESANKHCNDAGIELPTRGAEACRL